MDNNNDNKKSQGITIAVIAVAVLVLGYFLLKSSPQNQNPATASADDMHGGSPAAENNDASNALVGKPMPDIELSGADGKIYTAADFKGKTTVLFFNEGLMCYPACWNQIAAFGGDPRFNSDRIQALSVVVDSAKDWQRAIEKMPPLAKATMMFDADANASRKLGLLTLASSMHRGVFPGHTYVIIGADGIVRYVIDDPTMATANDMLFGKIGELK